MLSVIVTSIVASFLSAVVSVVPGFHIYNQLAIITLCLNKLPFFEELLSSEIIISIYSSLLVGYIFFVNIPSALFSAPDDSTFFTTSAFGKYVLKDDVFSAVMLSASGSAVALILILVLFPLLGEFISVVNDVLSMHYHWILWVMIIYLALSEWPKVYWNDTGGVWYWFRCIGPCLGGWFVLGLSGALGLIVLETEVLSAELNFMKLMPVFVGLFTVPGILLNIQSGLSISEQSTDCLTGIKRTEFLQGVGTGMIGGLFAAVIPGVTAGIGGLLSGQGAGLSSERSLLVSQGASRVAYYVGAMLMLFAVISGVSRGGMANMLRLNEVESFPLKAYYTAGASMLISCLVALLIMKKVFSLTVKVAAEFSWRNLMIVMLLLIAASVAVLFGMNGLIVLLTASAVGCMPVLFGCRRINCLGAILLPLAVMM